MVEPVARGAVRSPRGLILVLGLVATLAPTLARGQAPGTRTFNPVDSYTAETLLRRAGEQAAQSQWAEALDLYQKVIAQYSDAMARVPKGDAMADPSGTTTLYVDARQHAQARIAALPPEARALYRERVDATADRLYRQGLADRDREPLRRIVDQMFASSRGDDALELLGDLAFGEGRFGEALGYYRRIVADPRGRVPGLVHPDPDVNPARVAAKSLLARAAQGTDPPSAEEVRAFAAAYPDAKGSLAGREGPLARSVAAALAEDRLAPPAQSDGRWPTFAGSMSRSRIAPGPVDIGQFQWRIKLETPPPARTSPPMPSRGGGFGIPQTPPAVNTAEVPLPYYPIVLGDQVVVTDEGGMHAYHLNVRPGDTAPEAEAVSGSGRSGGKLVAWDQPLRSAFSAPQSRSGGPGAPRFTLTAAGDRIYGRLGGSGKSSSLLIAVRNNRDIEGKRLWEKASNEIALPRARPDAPSRFTAFFEGSPVADERNVYIALTEASGPETGAFVAALDAETGATRWVKYLGTAPSNDNGGGMGFNGGMGGMGPINTAAAGIGNRLLSLDGQTVYYQTNLGGVAALDAETGALRWLATYPVRERVVNSSQREANPAVVHDGLVFVAPEDALPIFAFDASTGRLAWKTPPLDRVTHLLGVAKGRLIATGDRVYSFDVKDGSLKSTWPDGPAGFEPYGRGLLAGDSIYWPTKAEIYVLDQATGMTGDREPIRLMQHYGAEGGNLAVGDGYLVVAQKDALVVFCQNRRLIDHIREEIARNPEPAAPYFQLARVAEATGQDELALTSLEQARSHARPSDTIDGLPLADEARAKQYKLLMRLAGRAEVAKEWKDQARRLSEAARAARNDRDRLAARLLLASAQGRAGDPAAAVVTLQDILADESLRSRSVPGDPEGRWTVRADLWVAEQLDAILKAGGRDLYAAYDAKAEALLTRGKTEKSARLLEEVARAYPAAKAAPESLLVLGLLREEDRKPAEAAHAYKALLASHAADALKARALLGLARAYESQDLILAAREALTRAQARYGDLRVEDPGRGVATVGSIVAERLSGGPLGKLAGDRPEAGFVPPLARQWERPWPAPGRPIAADGIPPSSSAGRVFLAEGTAIRPVNPSSGALGWTVDLGEEPAWVGYLADRLVIAGPTRIIALDPTVGAIRWRHPEGAARGGKPAANPFVAPPGSGTAGDRPTGRLHGFRVVGNRVFCLRGDRELIALDGDSGAVEWSFAPAGGGINASFLAGPRRVVLQLVDPGAQTTVVLDSDTGRRRGEFGKGARAAGDGPTEPWDRPPLAIDDDHACVTLDPATVALVDLNSGARVWTSRVGTPALPRKDPPRLLGDASHLLVVYEGNELIRLDPANGRQLWTRSVGAGRPGESPAAFALDADRLYCAAGANLSAYDFANGEPAWSRPLVGPKSAWSLVLADRYLAAYPTPRRDLGEDRTIDDLTFVVCKKADGALVQRLAFPSQVSDLAVTLMPRGALIATQNGAWSLAASPR